MKKKINGILTLVLVFVVQLSFAQEKSISGTVVDETNLPLPGATVIIKGTATGASTDFDGKYNINVNSGDILVFSYVGYADQEASVGIDNTINISLVPDNTLEEVVVTALGIKRKPDEVTTATQVVKGDKINEGANPNAVQALAGKVSGLQVNTSSTGVSGGNTSIVLRGVKSISGGSEALVVIDNVISSSTVLETLDPKTIESINVLKGANGAALYGNRGGNGVVIVTTKKGSKGTDKFTVDLNSTISIEEIAFLPQMQNRYGKGYWGEIDSFDQGSWGPEYDGSTQVVGTPYPTVTDWRYNTYEHIDDNMKPFFNTGTTYQNSVTISGGNVNNGYANLTLSKRESEGVIPDDVYKRDFLSLNSGKKLGKLTVSGIARYTSTRSNTVSAYNTDSSTDLSDERNVYQQLAQLPGNVDITQFSSGSNDDHWTVFGDSPYWVLKNSRLASRTNIFDLTGELSYEINKNIGLTLRSNLRNTDNNYTDYLNEYTETNSVTGDARDRQSNLEIQLSTARTLTTDFISTFDYDLTENISLSALAGANISETQSRLLNNFGTDLTIPGWYDIDNISSIVTANETKSKRRTQGIFAQALFGYKDYLFANLTGRQDYTSVLNTKGRKLKDLGFFYPSVGVSFIPTKAFPNLSGQVLHKLKISGGIVKVGNASAIGAHRLSETGVQAGGFPFAGLNSFVLPAATADQTIEPEFVNTTEFNVNMEFLKRKGIPRLTLDLATSFTKNTNQILNTSVSSTTGVTNALINIGETKSNALELDLGFTPIKTKDFEFNGSVSYSTYKTEVVKVTDLSDRIQLRGLGSVGTWAVEGEEFPLIQGTAYERDDQGRVVLDSGGLPKIAPGIKTLGKVTPDYILNFGAEFKYKNLKLSATADYRTGHQFYSNIYNNLTTFGRSVITAENGRGHFIYPNSTVEGSGVTNTTVLTGPSFGSGNPYQDYQEFINQNFVEADENFVLDATAFKLREVSLTYDLPSKLLNKSFINGVNIGISGRNLLTVLPKENRGYNDPEIGTGLGNYSQTPPTRTYSMSVNLKF
ncbi:MAG: SusC/RagA family TonB-linked outer membrane protein [Flavobacteriaceae bacterium]